MNKQFKTITYVGLLLALCLLVQGFSLLQAGQKGEKKKEWPKVGSIYKYSGHLYAREPFLREQKSVIKRYKNET